MEYFSKEDIVDGIVTKLQDLKTKIEEAEKKKAVSEEMIKELNKELKEKYGLDSIENARNELIRLDDEIGLLEQKRDKLLKEIEEIFGRKE